MSAAQAIKPRNRGSVKRHEPTGPKIDVYQEVTRTIVAALEEGTVPWRKPWRSVGGDVNRNLVSGKPYRGVNQLLLSLSGFSSPYWLTFKQAKEKGGKVRKGSKSTMIVFWKRLIVDDKDKPGQKKVIPMLRYYRVFNAEQCDGLEVPEAETLPAFDPVEEAERIISAMPNAPAISYGGDTACYVPAMDHVKLPVKEAFESVCRFYSTAFHELVHSTGHEKRCARKDYAKGGFGGEDYSREELVAEMGAAMLCTVSGIEPDYPQSASYIKSWLSALDNDPKMVIWAAGKAQRASDYVLGVQPDDGTDHE